jgi:hypothetical protein
MDEFSNGPGNGPHRMRDDRTVSGRGVTDPPGVSAGKPVPDAAAPVVPQEIP